MTQEKRYPYPCCGYLVHDEPPGSYDICPICFWEDDLWHVGFPLKGSGANEASMLEGQQNYLAFGACEERVKQFVRSPLPGEKRAEGWHVIDPAVDISDDSVEDWKHAQLAFFADPLSIYYWSPIYWRRKLKPEQIVSEHQTPSSDES